MNAADLAYWINERWRMFERKEQGGTYPFSYDPIMASTRWCNVHRENDAVTRWLAEHWRPEHHAAWEIVLSRMINYIPTLEVVHDLVPTLRLDDVEIVLKSLRDGGVKVFTSAYTISTCGQRMDKIDYVVGVVRAVKERDVDCECSLAGFHRWLTQVKGLGSFLAAQVVADLKNTHGHPLQTAPDWWTWAAPGPGSLRGLQAFYGRPCTARTFEKDIKQCWEATKPFINEDVPSIHMQDFQNCLCEFSKYMKIKENRGHARNRYRPAAR